jgi:hypothetical protein
VVYLDVPEEALAPAAQLTQNAFTRYIWDPATRAVAERNLQSQVLTWVYSADFPIRIIARTPVSLQGITFVRNKLPGITQVKNGVYGSPLFAGPDKPGGPRNPPSGFRTLKGRVGTDYPLPSMMLGYLGARGNTMEEVLNYLEAGAASDTTAPPGTVYFVT